jgi:hypothetical protein
MAGKKVDKKKTGPKRQNLPAGQGEYKVGNKKPPKEQKPCGYRLYGDRDSRILWR